MKVNGDLVHAESLHSIVLPKPAGFVSTRRDAHARDTIFDLLPPKLGNLFHAGRLDAQTEGLLVLTRHERAQPNTSR